MAELLKFPMPAIFIHESAATILFEKWIGSYPHFGTNVRTNGVEYKVTRVVIGPNHNRMAILLDEDPAVAAKPSEELDKILYKALESNL